MKLPFQLPLKKKELPSYYLALLLREEKATAVIFEEIQGKIQVIGKHEEEFKDSIESVDQENFLDTLDKAISKAESSLPSDVETQKTIFGLKETWIEGGKIKKEYLARLKKASDALGLSPIGFLVIHEAIAHLLQREEGAPVSAILVEIGKQYEVVSLLRAGRIIETHRAKVEDSIPQTSDRLFHHFSNPQVLPARIILLDRDNAEDLQQEFLSHSWSKSLPFLHVPQITVLPEGFDAKAMLFGAATQMGFEILGEELESVAKASTIEPLEKSEDIKEEKVAEENPQDADFGFVIGKDVKTKKAKIQQDNIAPIEDVKPKSQPIQPLTPQATGRTMSAAAIVAILLGLLGKVQSYLRKIKLPFKIPPAVLALTKGPKAMLVLPVIAVIVILGILFYLFGTSSDVKLFADGKVIEKKQDVQLTETGTTDTSQSTIHISLESVDEQGSTTTQATGKKEVGTKAKGTVTLFSIATDSKTFPAGTSVTSSNNLKFTFDNSVTIASASAGSNQPTATVNITASDVGQEYNLPSGTKFSVDSFDTSILLAKNDNALSGGTKKEVTVVSKDDVTKATNDLVKNLEGKAKDEISKKINSDSSLVSQFIKEDMSQKSLSKQVGDEASSLTLKGTVTYQTAIVKTKEADDFAKQLLKPDDSALSAQSVSYSFNKVESKDNTISATFDAKAIILPNIDQKKLADEISGKSYGDAKNILTKIPQISDVSFIMHPSLPFFPKALPRIGSHIHFQIVKNG